MRACKPQYDTDVTTWSPQGRLFQVEYAMEAVKQGSCAVGLKVICLARPLPHALSALLLVCLRAPQTMAWCPLTLQSNTHVVLATLKRSESELSSYQRKVFKIDDHMGIAIAGLTADGRILCRHMRNECLNHRSVSSRR